MPTRGADERGLTGPPRLVSAKYFAMLIAGEQSAQSAYLATASRLKVATCGYAARSTDGPVNAIDKCEAPMNSAFARLADLRA